METSKKEEKKKYISTMQVAWNHDLDTHFQRLNTKMQFC
jgi:hypothetical protein